MAWVRKAPSGRWQARWRDPGGRERVRTFRLKAEAERFLISVEDSKHRGAYNDPNAGRETLEAFWRSVRSSGEATGRLSERTLIAYDDIWRLYLSPKLGRRPLNTITRSDVEDLVAAIPSPWRAHDTLKVLRMALGRAVRAGRSRPIPRRRSSCPRSNATSRGHYPPRSWIDS